jgi:uncharacterized 2Fe-2S/4Fe-4S cluster protein (DUF4445 family)
MPEVTFHPVGTTVDVPTGTDLITAAQLAGTEIRSPCGTKGTCGKCVVRIISGTVDGDPSGLLSPEALRDGYVQACRTRIGRQAVSIEIPTDREAEGQFADAAGALDRIDPKRLPDASQRIPLTINRSLEIPEPKADEGLSDLDRLSLALQAETSRKPVCYPLSIIRRAADAIRSEAGRVTLTYAELTDHHQVIDLRAGTANPISYGLAIDIGTTTIAVQLVSLPAGQILATTAAYNEQVACGLDVISRINYARRSDGQRELQMRVLRTINRLIEQTAGTIGINSRCIHNVVVSGNTTMTHLFLGLNPEYIRIAPYTPTMLDIPLLRAADLELAVHPETRVHLSPCVGSYVGGDITAGLLCTELAGDSDDICLFIDIGTNGELAVGNHDFILTCACSAGPAFEGGGLRHGMRATRGAVEKVAIDPETGTADCRTIGDIEPIGLCGSGMISLVAGLLNTGWMDAAGKLDRTRSSDAIRIEGRQAVYQLTAATEDKAAITVSEQEIENIIRAKAAIYAAAALMLQQAGLTFSDLSRVYIAGGFGHYLDLEEAVTIGLLPDLPRRRFEYLGNTSLAGSYMILISKKFRQRQQSLSRRMTYVDLGNDNAYMDQYTAALFLPHTDRTAFPSVLPTQRTPR